MSIAIAADPIPLRQDERGVIRVGSTRVTLDTVVGAFKGGACAEPFVWKAFWPATRTLLAGYVKTPGQTPVVNPRIPKPQ